MKHCNTLERFYIKAGYYKPLSFITSFKNLREIVIDTFFVFKELDFRHVTFSNLQILNIPYGTLSYESFMKFLEMNGNNLIELSISRLNRNSKPYIAQFCPNLKIFFTIFDDYELDTLKTMFDDCQHLESIKVWCGGTYLNEREMLEAVV